MKTINVTFTDKEILQIAKVKGSQSWHDFILKLSEKKKHVLLCRTAGKHVIPIAYRRSTNQNRSYIHTRIAENKNQSEQHKNFIFRRGISN